MANGRQWSKRNDASECVVSTRYPGASCSTCNSEGSIKGQIKQKTYLLRKWEKCINFAEMGGIYEFGGSRKAIYIIGLGGWTPLTISNIVSYGRRKIILMWFHFLYILRRKAGYCGEGSAGFLSSAASQQVLPSHECEHSSTHRRR